jgi:mono/diheme cytochrome c family protein
MINNVHKSIWLFIAGVVWVGVACCAPVQAETPSADPTNPFYNDHAAAQKGEELFGRNCQQCHNSRGKGGKGPQLVRGSWAPGGANSDAFMYFTIVTGRPGTPMGSFATSLSPDEIWQVITFLREESQRVKAAAAKNKGDEEPW